MRDDQTQATTDSPDDPPADRPARRWRALPTTGRQLARDVTLVIVGAAVALAAEEWRDGRERQRRVEVALAGIRGELRENQQIVQGARALHLRMRDSLQSYIRRGATPSPALCRRRLFAPALPLSTAWQTARETGVLADMPYATVLALGQVYEQQARYRALGDAMAHAINIDYQREGLDAYLRARCANFAVLEEDFANREGILALVYRDGLHALDARPAR